MNRKKNTIKAHPESDSDSQPPGWKVSMIPAWHRGGLKSKRVLGIKGRRPDTCLMTNKTEELLKIKIKEKLKA